MPRFKNNALINFLAFQIAWFACVLSAAQGQSWLGVAVAVCVVAWHLYHANDSQLELILIVITAIFGSLFDQTLMSLDLVRYASAAWPSYLLPVWMVMMWMIFATTLNLSMRWLRGHYWMASLLGLIGGPLAYLGGVKLGAMQFLQTNTMLISLALGWAFCMPALLWLSTRTDGYISSHKF
jgi:Protein of unknown function (DUF2878)